jgi:hypothetical protein
MLPRPTPSSARRPRRRRAAAAARARPAAGLLRARRHRLAASQDAGCLLPGGRLAHLRPPDSVRRGRDDLRRAALRHGHPAGSRPRRHGGLQRRARPGRRRAAGPPARHRHPVPGGLLPVRGHQAGPGHTAPSASVAPARGAGAHAQLLRQRHRDHLHPGRGHLPDGPGARRCRQPTSPRSLLVVGTLPDIVEDQFRACSISSASARCISCRRAIRRAAAGWGRAPGCWRSRSSATPSPPSASAAARQLIAAPYPFGIEGTCAWLRAAATAFGIDPQSVVEVLRSPVERAERALARYRRSSAASASVPARLPAGDPAGPLPARGVRHGARGGGRALPRPPLMAEELPLLPAGQRLSEGQDVEKPSSTACAPPPRPDGLRSRSRQSARSRRADGPSGRSSWCSRPMHGFDQAADLAELFARRSTRRERLAV